MNKAKKIQTDNLRTQWAMNCYEAECPFSRVCANHDSAGDFRTASGFTPQLHLRDGKVYCESIFIESEGCHGWPIGHHKVGCVLGNELVEKTNDFQI